MAMIPSERFVFADMTVLDNLLLGGANDPDADRRAEAPEARPRAVPDPRRALRAGRRHDVGRPAADGQPGPGADGQPQAADARRAVARPRPGRRPADLRHRPPPRRHRGSRRAAARAERRPGAAHRRPLLRDALRSGDPRGDSRRDARPRVLLGVCSRHAATADELPRSIAFLDEPGHLLRVATVDDDGFPRVVPIWFIRRDDEILFTPRGPSVFLANIRRDPACRAVDRRGPAAVPQGDRARHGPHRPRRRQRRRVARPLPLDRQALRPRRGRRRLRRRHRRSAARARSPFPSTAPARAPRRGGCPSATRTAPASGPGATTSTARTWPSWPTPAPAASRTSPTPDPADLTADRAPGHPPAVSRPHHNTRSN